MTRMSGDRTRVSAANPDNISVRTTIPAFIARRMGLNVGSVLDWDLDKVDGVWVATIRREES